MITKKLIAKLLEASNHISTENNKVGNWIQISEERIKYMAIQDNCTYDEMIKKLENYFKK